MRSVLQVNKFLYPRAGAETVLLDTRRLLEARGHEVLDFAMADPRNVPSRTAEFFAKPRGYDQGRSSVGAATDALSTIYDWSARWQLRRLLSAHRPDVAHLHNVYHQLSTSVVDELWAQKVPMVMTVHDYKPVCPSYVMFRDGAPCRRCVGGHPFHAIGGPCVKSSRAASAVAALEAQLVRARKTYDRVSVFVAPSHFMASVLESGGVGTGRIKVIRNFITAPSAPSKSSDAPYVLFLGRLEDVKGVGVLLDAARLVQDAIEIRVAGEGVLASSVAAAPRPVHYLGRLDRAAADQQLRGASAVVVPSLWEENCPMVVLEAQARGVPVVVSDRGGLPELVTHGQDGWITPAGSSQALAAAIIDVARDPQSATRIGERGRTRAERDYDPDSHYEELMRAYEIAMASRTKGTSRAAS